MMFFSAIRYTNDYLDYKHMKYYIYLYMRKYTRCKDLFFPTSHWVSLFLQVNSGSQLCETGTVAQTWQIQSRPLVSFTPMSQEKKRWQFVIRKASWHRQRPIVTTDCCWLLVICTPQTPSVRTLHGLQMSCFRGVHGVLPSLSSFDCGVKACVCKIEVTCSLLFYTWPLFIWHALVWCLDDLSEWVNYL